MSDLEVPTSVTVCGGRGEVAAAPVLEVLPARRVALGEGTEVRRLLPTLGRRMVGAWCFVDHYGPDDVAALPGMRVGPHPHMGLQTVSWLLAGEVLHRDSLGSEQAIRPGELGLMSAGHGISHSEESPVPHPALLHGAQLWLALPGRVREGAPSFEHHGVLPRFTDGPLSATLMVGELGGLASAATVHTPLVGMDVRLEPGEARLPLEPDFEYAVLTFAGAPVVEGAELAPGTLAYLGCGRRELAVSAAASSGFLLLGGEPFEERIVMWWNLIGRDSDEIAAAREAWMGGDRFGTVHGYDGGPIPAPGLPPGRLRPRGRTS